MPQLLFWQKIDIFRELFSGRITQHKSTEMEGTKAEWFTTTFLSNKVYVLVRSSFENGLLVSRSVRCAVYNAQSRAHFCGPILDTILLWSNTLAVSFSFSFIVIFFPIPPRLFDGPPPLSFCDGINSLLTGKRINFQKENEIRDVDAENDFCGEDFWPQRHLAGTTFGKQLRTFGERDS